MTNEEFRRVVRDPEIAGQLLDQASKIQDGIQTVTVKQNQRKRQIRAVRLNRIGTKLYLSGSQQQQEP